MSGWWTGHSQRAGSREQQHPRNGAREVKDGSGPNQEIRPIEGSVFLLGQSNDSIEQVTGDRLVALDFVSRQALRDWLDDQEEE